MSKQNSISNNLIPTAEELENHALSILENLDDEERAAWYHSPMTKAVLVLLELSRMESFEALEGSPPENIARTLMAKAQLAEELRDDIYHKLVEKQDDN